MGCRPFKCMLVRQVLPQEHVGHGAELVVPRFAEATDEGFAQELVEADAALCAEADGILADVPTMVVEAGEGAQLLLADGVEVAADGLLPEEAAAGAAEGTVAAKGCGLCQITPQKARKFANNFVVSGEKAYFAFHKT